MRRRSIAVLGALARCALAASALAACEGGTLNGAPGRDAASHRDGTALELDAGTVVDANVLDANVIDANVLDANVVDANVVDRADDAATALDAPASDLDAFASPDALAAPDAGPSVLGVAPPGAVAGEIDVLDGDTALIIDGPVVLRVEADPSEHITFFLSFDPPMSEVAMEVHRWNGDAAARLGRTDAGRGLRTLAVFDPSEPRTFWAIIDAPTRLEATLTVTRVPFRDGRDCDADCAHLLQLPLPNDPRADGYAIGPGTVFRYQYGRRDMLMFIRHAGQRLAALGMAPLIPYDLSQWDGLTPGLDVGASRHASHQRGKDVDISLYGTDGQCIWRSYCETTYTADGRECIPGTMTNYDGVANAIFFGDFYASGRVTMCFLDRELIPATRSGAGEASMEGLVDPALLPLYANGRHLQHWPFHDNHIHVRISELEPMPGARSGLSEPAAFEPP